MAFRVAVKVPRSPPAHKLLRRTEREPPDRDGTIRGPVREDEAADTSRLTFDIGVWRTIKSLAVPRFSVGVPIVYHLCGVLRVSAFFFGDKGAVRRGVQWPMCRVTVFGEFRVLTVKLSVYQCTNM